MYQSNNMHTLIINNGEKIMTYVHTKKLNKKIWKLYCKDAKEDDDDEDTEEEGVTRDDPSGDFRHTGHVAFNLSHSSMQLAWK